MRRIVFSLLTAAVLFSSAALAQKGLLPDGPGKDVTQRVCGQCHAAEMVTTKGKTRDGWTQLVDEMISRGAQGSDDDFGTVVDYLTANFPPKTEMKKVNVNTADAAELTTSLELAQKDSAAIVDYRKQNGVFKTLADLKKVPGVDGAKLDSVKDRITF